VSFGVYVHVPFCAVRCGYCDFNTYTATELGGGGAQSEYAGLALAELDRARAEVGERVVDTVFFGGGTPTLLPTGDLVRILDGISTRFGLADGVEVTTEANPESVDARALARLRDAGFTRISFGMQSAVPHVLRVLDRTHRPERIPQVVRWAKDAGFEHVSLDLIYGTPGESVDDWCESVAAALAVGPDHVSAYALVIEDGTALARRVRAGDVPSPDDDDLAEKYELADALLTGAGLQWYEVSNWAAGAAARCRHNLGYWRGDDWWGVGPGAHSHVAGRRWWNVKHPSAYAQRLLGADESPVAGEEWLGDEERHVEAVLLGMRLSEGLSLAVLSAPGLGEAQLLADQGLLEVDRPEPGRTRLTLRGRLLADHVVRRLLTADEQAPAP
jgi:putative oxygen-independent coproporphyrinogen III oxidase